MPYACFTFGEATDVAMRETAVRIASSSAFTPEQVPFHVPIMGSLHTYPNEHIFEAFGSSPTPVVTGRFTKWELRASQLRACVELLDADTLCAHLAKQMPRGRPWKSHYVVLGSVSAIDTERHDEFLRAVVDAFPIDASVTFPMGRLEYHVGPKDASAAVATPVALESGKASAKRTPAPVAKQMSVVPTAHAAAGIGKRRNSKRRKPAKASPHRKWERTANTIDEIIKANTGGTGTRSRSDQAAHKAAINRAQAIDKNRQVEQRTVWKTSAE